MLEFTFSCLADIAVFEKKTITTKTTTACVWAQLLVCFLLLLKRMTITKWSKHPLSSCSRSPSRVTSPTTSSSRSFPIWSSRFYLWPEPSRPKRRRRLLVHVIILFIIVFSILTLLYSDLSGFLFFCVSARKCSQSLEHSVQRPLRLLSFLLPIVVIVIVFIQSVKTTQSQISLTSLTAMAVLMEITAKNLPKSETMTISGQDICNCRSNFDQK